MTFETMNAAAHQGIPMLDGLSLPEQSAYLKLRWLHDVYAKKEISREEAATRKKEIGQELEHNKRLFDECVLGYTALKLLRQSDVPEVRRVLEELGHGT